MPQNELRVKGIRHTPLFHAPAPLVIVVIHFLLQLLHTSNDNGHVAFIIYGYSKLTRRIPTGKTTAMHIATTILDLCVVHLPHQFQGQDERYNRTLLAESYLSLSTRGKAPKMLGHIYSTAQIGVLIREVQGKSYLIS